MGESLGLTFSNVHQFTGSLGWVMRWFCFWHYITPTMLAGAPLMVAELKVTGCSSVLTSMVMLVPARSKIVCDKNLFCFSLNPVVIPPINAATTLTVTAMRIIDDLTGLWPFGFLIFGLNFRCFHFVMFCGVFPWNRFILLRLNTWYFCSIEQNNKKPSQKGKRPENLGSTVVSLLFFRRTREVVVRFFRLIRFFCSIF